VKVNFHSGLRLACHRYPGLDYSVQAELLDFEPRFSPAWGIPID